MCGIAGVLALGARPPDPAWGPLLLEALAHRGPDGSAIYSDGRALLVHARLAIIDTGSGGAQPMHAGDGRHVIVQNGEIYNFKELAPEAERQGARLRSRSDTEVLLELVAREKDRALPRLRGMFAFGLYDRESGSLMLARDRLGKKPIVWTATEDFFAFASEARALLRLPFVRARLDREALPHYLRHFYVPAPRTLLQGIRKLPAASWMEVRPGAPIAAPVRWWRPPAPDPAARADGAWFERFDRELLEATSLRTVSDVPIGVFLSGGVDSNVVLEALHRAGHRPIRTFTLGFEGLPDERAVAKIGAKRFADEHVELVVKPDLERDIESVLARFGDPLGDSAVVTNALIAREAAKHVKVVLNGDGGDELFGGYPRYPFSRRADLSRLVPGASTLLQRRYRTRSNAGPALAWLASSRPAEAASALCGFFSHAELASLLAPAFAQPAPLEPPPFPGAEGPGLVDALFAWDTGVYLPDDLLVKVDVASMAYGIENRSPLLDHRLFERLGELPPARRADPFRTKPLLRRYARGRIPEEALAAPKRGFQLPVESWLRGPLRGWLDGLLGTPGATAPLFREGAVRRRLDEFHAGRGDELAALRLWALAALEFWAREYAVEL